MARSHTRGVACSPFPFDLGQGVLLDPVAAGEHRAGWSRSRSAGLPEGQGPRVGDHDDVKIGAMAEKLLPEEPSPSPREPPSNLIPVEPGHGPSVEAKTSGFGAFARIRNRTISSRFLGQREASLEASGRTRLERRLDRAAGTNPSRFPRLADLTPRDEVDPRRTAWREARSPALVEPSKMRGSFVGGRCQGLPGCRSSLRH